MRRLRYCLVFLVFVPALLSAQELTVVPSGRLAQRRRAMEEAYHTWIKGDDHLERDIFRRSSAEVERRINIGQANEAAYAEARSRYFGALIQQVQTIMSELASSGTGMDVSRMEKSLREELTAIDQTKSSLQDEVGSLQGNPTPRLTLKATEALKQMDQLQHLEADLRQQTNELASMREQANLNSDSQAKMLQTYADVLGVFKTELHENANESRIWSAYYESLRGLVRARETSADKRDHPHHMDPKE